jgi:hypothetical protein
VRRSGTRFRVTAQLIQATDGVHLAPCRSDSEMNEIFALQKCKSLNGLVLLRPDEADGFETILFREMEDVGQHVSGTPDLLTW